MLTNSPICLASRVPSTSRSLGFVLMQKLNNLNEAFGSLMSFTFVTSTGAGQSPSAAKKVRGHVTRVVFAQRRADRAQAQDRGHSGTTKQKFQAKRKAAVKNRGETQASANGAISNVSIPLAPCHKYTTKELAIVLSKAISHSDPHKSAEICKSAMSTTTRDW